MTAEDTPITLNWVVPARRAVVTGECNYYDILIQWVHQLREHGDTLKTWYGISDNAFDFQGVMWALQWASAMGRAVGRQERSVSAATRNTFGRTRPWFVRIWFGPWRMLHTDDWDTICNERGEVRAPTATFYPGDLIEFPFHLFLHACQPSAGFETIQFNGQGSPFLGNSVLKDGQPPSGDFSLHDNVLAMRFQLLLNLAIGAFSSIRRVHGAQTAPLVELNNQGVYARGMIYGGSFAKRIINERAAGVDRYWGIWTNHWCRSAVATSATIPTPGSRNAMVSARGHAYLNALRLTPAWACSPSTLMLTFYMLNGNQGGSNNVSATWGYQGVRDNGNPPAYATRVTANMLGDAVGGFRNANEVKTLQVLPGPDGEAINHQIAHFPGAVNVVSRSAHEEAFVRLFAPRCLIDRERMGSDRPHAGFLSAYDPFTGADYCPEALAETGQLYQFEATGALGRWIAFNPPDTSNGRHVFGTGLFNWNRVEHNQMRLRQGGLMTFHPSRTRMPRTVRMFCIRIDENEHPESYAPGALYRPIVFKHPSANQGLPSNEAVNTHYARRAIPFMTMEEFQSLGLYDSMDQVNSKIQGVITEFSNHVRSYLVTDEPPAPAEGVEESMEQQRIRRWIRTRRLLRANYLEDALNRGEAGNHRTFFEQLGFHLDPR